jgi:hypothetical protein
MSTKLEGDQKLRRLIRISGVGEVEVSISQLDGVQFRVPGTRTYLTLPWMQAVGNSYTPASVKSYHMGKPVEFLKSTIEKRSREEQSI